MSFLEAVLLGALQGLTEFLPVSSSGHLALARILFGFENTLTTDILLHCATLFAIIWFFRQRILALKFKEWLMLALATLPVAMVGLLFRNQLEILSNSWQFIVFGLIITSVFSLISQLILSNKLSAFFLPNIMFVTSRLKLNLTLTQLMSVGIAQILALAPGISRSGTTVSWGLICGFSRKDAFSWSFLLAIPAISGATLVEVLHLFENNTILNEINLMTFLAMISAFTTGLLSLTLLKYLLNNAQIWWFSLYTFSLAIIVTLFMIFN